MVAGEDNYDMTWCANGHASQAFSAQSRSLSLDTSRILYLPRCWSQLAVVSCISVMPLLHSSQHTQTLGMGNAATARDTQLCRCSG
jgi:hypothetical protein